MHNPSKKQSRTPRQDFSYGPTLMLAKQGTEVPRVKENRSRESKNLKPMLIRDRFLGRIQEMSEQLNYLKVDGREINSVLTVESSKIKYSSKNPTIIKFPPQELQELLERPPEKHIREFKRLRAREDKGEDKFDYAKSYPNILAEQQPAQDVMQGSTGSVLPEINTLQKDIAVGSNHAGERKGHHYKSIQRQSERENYSLVKYGKRRDTVIETSNTAQKLKSQEPTRNKQENKKLSSFTQYRQFLMTICLTNKVISLPEEEAQYRAYICKGNNGLLVKSILKTRPWWTFRNGADIDTCHIVWTEWKRNKSIVNLPQHAAASLKIACPPHQLVIKSSNKEIKQKTEKKYSNFSKVVGKNTNLLVKYDDSMLNDNYLTFSSKINVKSFQDAAQKHLGKEDYQTLPKPAERKLVNHIPGCYYLHSKKLLFISISKYYEKLGRDVFSVIPMTFLITKGLNDPEFERFSKYFDDHVLKNKGKTGSNIWICKPGQNSNRGNGIEVVSSINQIRNLVGQKCGSTRTLIIQKYMQNPFLYNKRKFDLRCYILITCVGGAVKGYWYQEGYVRTTSKEYTLKNLENKLIHLTNDAIQKKGQQYGKFEGFNKVSFSDLEKYIEANTEVKFKDVYQRIKSIATDLIVSTARKINPHHKEFTFEIFGLDFMLDDKLTPFLIEANSNPCLEVDGNVLARVIPPMIENAIRVAIDPLFPPPYSESLRMKFSPPNSTFESNRMALVYDSLHDFPKGDLLDAAQPEDKECEEFEGDPDEE